MVEIAKHGQGMHAWLEPIFRRNLAPGGKLILSDPSRALAMVEDEGAALGGAIQAAWALERRSNTKAAITQFTEGIVGVNAATRCEPDKARAARYRELQALQDKLSLSLREVFPQQRKLAE